MDFSFIEADVFTKQILDLLSDEELGELQAALIQKPDLGVLIPGGRGLRKLRWQAGAKGKRGGIRVIYYLQLKDSLIYFVSAFKKSKKADLDYKHLRILADYVKEWIL